MKKKWKEYKFRASSLGKLMCNGRKKGELSETTKSYLLELYLEETYGRRRDCSNKYMDKGNYAELTDSLDILSDYYGKLLSSKDLNSESIENEYMTGTPDILKIKSKVIDIKSSWDLLTFAQSDGSNRDYQWQLWAYMWMTNRKQADLAYCLSNAPVWMIESEHKRKMYSFSHLQGTDEYEQLHQYWEDYFEKNMLFDDVDKRIKVFSFEFDETKIPVVQDRINNCREYLNSLEL